MADNEVSVTILANDSSFTGSLAECEASITGFVESTQAKMQEVSSATGMASAESVTAIDAIGNAAAMMGEKVDAGVEMAVAGLEQLEGRFSAVQKMMSTLAEVAVVGFIGEKVMELGKKYGEVSEQLSITAQKTGMATNAIQQLNFAANAAGVSADSVQGGMIGLARAIGQAEAGSKAQAAAFDQIGISAQQLKSMTLEEVFYKVADAMHGWADGAEKDALAGRRFLGVGTEMIPVMNLGSQGIKTFGDRATELGIVMDEQMVAKGEEANRAFKELGAVFDYVKIKIGAELAPALEVLITELIGSAKEGGALDMILTAVRATLATVEVVVSQVATEFRILKVSVEGAAKAFMQWATNVGIAAASQAPMNDGLKMGTKNINEQTDAMIRQLEIQQKTRSEAFVHPEKYVKGAYQDQNDRMGGGERLESKSRPSIPQTMGGGPKKGAGGESQMGIWKEQLQEIEEANNEFFKNNLATEDSFWTAKLQLVKAGSKEWYAIEHELFSVHKQEAQLQLATDVESLRAQQSEEQNGGLKRVILAQQIADRIAQAYGQGSKEQLAELAKVNKEAAQYVQAQLKEQDNAIKESTAAQLRGFADEKGVEKDKLALHTETTAQELENLKRIENQMIAVEREGFAQRLALYSQDSKEYRKTLDEKLKAEQQHNAEMQKLNLQTTQNYMKTWDEVYTNITGALNASIMSMINGSATFGQAMRKMAATILNDFIMMTLRMGEEWVFRQIMMTVVANTQEAQRNVDLATQAAAGVSVESALGMNNIAIQAAQAAAGAYASTAAIPVVGPGLAPAAASQAYAATMSFAAAIPAYEGGGWNIPQRQLAMLHTNEMVLPSWGAQGIRDLISGGGTAGNSTPNVTIHQNNNMGGVIGADAFKGLLAQHSDQVMDAVYTAVRNFRK